MSLHDLTTFQVVVKRTLIVIYSGMKLVNHRKYNDFEKRKWQDRNTNTGQFKKQTHAGQ